MNIKPKPTRYRDILFRSRLEAKWAIVFDNLPNVLHWQYEPCTYKIQPYNWDYTPDFYVVLYHKGERIRQYVEIKPKAISKEYNKFLITIAPALTYPLAVFESSLFPAKRRGSMTLLELHCHIYFRTKQKVVHNDYALQEFFPDILPAVNKALNYRFDLKGG